MSLTRDFVIYIGNSFICTLYNCTPLGHIPRFILLYMDMYVKLVCGEKKGDILYMLMKRLSTHLGICTVH